MDPVSVDFTRGWLELAMGPLGGAIVGGMLLGAVVGIYCWQKWVVTPRIVQHEAGCEAKLQALRDDIDKMRPVVDRWQKFIEKQAFASLGVPGGVID